ncbi:contractile injection system protein, VgrG/Pvc8 family (plasmid) [Enterobacter bugandensis]|uniref:phage baseplate assembly protein V n=1 Tax=Enterobacter bugandensis TaxID=881260 RepID=UPI00283AA42E|nr:contractile injection system protein, VgrG/Pvc8 family [Enterobacter bugandensis]WMU75405.1 contractile injection system protein, VgrG/Pvc8 family [Enterobacter bugandensis]
MSFGSFKDRISHVTSEAKDDVTRLTQDTLSAPENTWADKLDLVTDLPGAPKNLTSKLPGGGEVTFVPVTVTVQTGGQVLDAKKIFISAVQTRHAVNEIPGATVTMSIPQAAPDDYSGLDALLSHCKVGQTATLKADKLTVFTGVIGVLQVKKGEKEWRVNMRLKHGLQGLKATSRSRVWKAGKDAELIRQILGEHREVGVKAGTVSLTESEAVQRQQWNCSDWHFVRALLGLHGAWLWPQSDGSVNIHSPKMGGKSHRISAKASAGGLRLLNAEWNYSGLRQVKGGLTHSWDLSTQSVVKKNAQNKFPGNGGLSPAGVKPLGLQNEVLLPGQWDGSLQQATADSGLIALHAQAVRGRFTLAGCQPVQPGDTVVLEGFGAHLSGQGMITQVEYVVSQQGRPGETVICVGLDEEAASAPALPVPTGMVIGTVAKYKADPKSKWNRLPVTIAALGTEVLWARMGHVYASKDSGVSFYPEEGDEVVLVFTGSDPVIVAAVHSPKRAAPIEPSARNAQKGVVLRHEGKRAGWLVDRDKHTLLLELGDDKKPEQHLLLDAAKGLVVTSEKGDVNIDLKTGGVEWKAKKNIALQAEEQITATAKTGISAESHKDLTLTAEAKLQVIAKASVGLTSEKGKLLLSPEKAELSGVRTSVTGSASVDIKSDAELKLKGMNVDVKGDGEVGVSGAKVAVKGQAEASLESDAAVKVAGQMTDIGGAGITNVKGSMVNLG